jgi:hypothetical protein
VEGAEVAAPEAKPGVRALVLVRRGAASEVGSGGVIFFTVLSPQRICFLPPAAPGATTVAVIHNTTQHE